MYVNFTLDNLRNGKILITCGYLTQPSVTLHYIFKMVHFLPKLDQTRVHYFQFSFFFWHASRAF